MHKKKFKVNQYRNVLESLTVPSRLPRILPVDQSRAVSSCTLQILFQESCVCGSVKF